MKDRPSGGISEPKEPFAHPHAPMEDLMEIIRLIIPSIYEDIIFLSNKISSHCMFSIVNYTFGPSK